MKFTVALLAVVGIAEANWKSGSVSTYEKFSYGKFVTRMKAPDRKGTVSSFFTYWDGPGFYPGGWNELDVEIVPSVEENPLSTNMIFGDGHNKLEDHDYVASFHPHDEWHTYELEWTPDYISFAIDGDEVRHLSTKSNEGVKFINKAQSLRMNFWTPTFHSWGKGFDPVDMPWYVLYDYVEVFTYNEHLNEFEFHWRDDFNAFDSGRWHKASGGFEANSSVFYPSNVYTSGGNLVIKMEPMESHHSPLEHHEGPGLHGLLHEHQHSQARHLEPREDNIESLLHHGGEDRHSMPRHHWTQAHKYGRDHEDVHRHRVATHRSPIHHERLHLHEKTGHHSVTPAHHEAQLHEAIHHEAALRETAHHEPVHHERVSAHLQPRHAPIAHEEVHHEAIVHEDHEVHPELDHHYDDQHDVEPQHFHEHAVHKATLHSVMSHDSEHHEPSHFEKLHGDAHKHHDEHKAAEAAHHEEHPRTVKPRHSPEVTHHESPRVQAEHRDQRYHADHETHPELDHHYDDQHDVEPKHFHEHAVHKAFDHPDSHDYAHTKKEAHHEKHYYDRHYSEHEQHHEDVTFDHKHIEYRPEHYVSHHETYRYEEPHHEVVHEEPRHESYHHEDYRREDYHHEAPHYEVSHHEVTHHERRYDEPHEYWSTHESPELATYRHEHVAEEQLHDGHRFSVGHVDEEVTPYEYSHQEGRHYEHAGYDESHESRREHYHGEPDRYWTHEAGYEAGEFRRHHGEAVAAVHEDERYHADHETHPELDHHYDDQHDVEPKHFHEHAVHKAFDHPDSHSYSYGVHVDEDRREERVAHAEEGSEHYASYYEPLDVTHHDREHYVREPHFVSEHGARHEREGHEYYERPHERYGEDHHREISYHKDHETHPELDHHYDDKHDVEPVHFHEHAVHHAFDHPESRSYHRSDFEHEYRPYGEGHHYATEERYVTDHHFEEPITVHDERRVSVEELPYEHHGHRYEVTQHGDYHHVPTRFIVEEPLHETSHQTFHGREIGYMYREHGDEHAHGHLDYHVAEPEHEIRHEETYGTHHKADRFEREHGLHDYDFAEQHTEHYVEPVYEHGERERYVHDTHFEPPQHHPREVEYEIDELGHVHMFEETPTYDHAFVQ